VKALLPLAYFAEKNCSRKTKLSKSVFKLSETKLKLCGKTDLENRSRISLQFKTETKLKNLFCSAALKTQNCLA
jgi:hypothetical protein